MARFPSIGIFPRSVALAFKAFRYLHMYCVKLASSLNIYGA